MGFKVIDRYNGDLEFRTELLCGEEAPLEWTPSVFPDDRKKTKR
jgi:hypothetical protein